MALAVFCIFSWLTAPNAVRAQDNTRMEELQRKIEEQQRRLEAQQVMMERQAVSASYRHMLDPDTGWTGPIPVWSAKALRDGIIED
jgi:hypothetical protein